MKGENLDKRWLASADSGLFVEIRMIVLGMVAAVLIAGCAPSDGDRSVPEGMTVDLMLKTTPVKDQGQSELCWAYAMLATIETDRLMVGDSVNLSADYLARVLMEQQVRAAYLTQGRTRITTRGTVPLALRLATEHGLTHYDAYHPGPDTPVLCRMLRRAVEVAVAKRSGLEHLSQTAGRLLDEAMRPLPGRVYMYGAEYTPQEFARSVDIDDYVAMTSFTHHPFGEAFALEIADNYSGETFLNVPIDSLQATIDRALDAGHAVCWEGDTSEPGFSVADGLAVLQGHAALQTPTQEMRQRDFERLQTTDDHCMTIVGRAHDSAGTHYYICKNSWGTAGPWGGFIYMSAAYLRLKTIAVVVKVTQE